MNKKNTHMIKLIFKVYKKTNEMFFLNFFFYIYIKMTNNYHQKNKEKLSKNARERHQNFSEEEKGKKYQYACRQYRNLSEEEKE